MLNCLLSYISVYVDLEKLCNFAQKNCPMSGQFILTRDILGKKLRFLWFSLQTGLKTHQFGTKKWNLALPNHHLYLKHHRHWENGKKSIVQITRILASIPDLGKSIYSHNLLALWATIPILGLKWTFINFLYNELVPKFRLSVVQSQRPKRFTQFRLITRYVI